MTDRQAQLDTHRFLSHRVTTAFITGEADQREPALRRINRTLIVSLLVGLLLAAGAGLRLSATGSTDPGQWRDAGALVVERETGATFVYTGGVLHPVLNIASARLLLDAESPRTRLVPHKVLVTAPRGQTLGIAGAPNDLPAPADLLGLPWTICDTGADAGPGARGTLTIGAPVTGGAPPHDAILATAADGRWHLLWQGRQLLVQKDQALGGLGWTTAGFYAGPALLGALPQGPDLAAPVVERAGQPGPSVAGRPATVGQLFVVRQPGATDRYFVLLSDGLAAIGETARRLLVAAGTLRPVYGGGEPVPVLVAADGLASTPTSARNLTPAGFPDAVPALESVDPAAGTVCVAGTNQTPVVALTVRDGGDDRDQAAVPTPGDRPDAVRRLVVPGGHGALVRTRDSDATWLVTAAGARFPIADRNAQRALGYGAVQPVTVPAGMLAALPEGPRLSRSAAEAVAG